MVKPLSSHSLRCTNIKEVSTSDHFFPDEVLKHKDWKMKDLMDLVKKVIKEICKDPDNKPLENKLNEVLQEESLQKFVSESLKNEILDKILGKNSKKIESHAKLLDKNNKTKSLDEFEDEDSIADPHEEPLGEDEEINEYFQSDLETEDIPLQSYEEIEESPFQSDQLTEESPFQSDKETEEFLLQLNQETGEVSMESDQVRMESVVQSDHGVEDSPLQSDYEIDDSPLHSDQETEELPSYTDNYSDESPKIDNSSSDDYFHIIPHHESSDEQSSESYSGYYNVKNDSQRFLTDALSKKQPQSSKAGNLKNNASQGENVSLSPDERVNPNELNVKSYKQNQKEVILSKSKPLDEKLNSPSFNVIKSLLKKPLASTCNSQVPKNYVLKERPTKSLPLSNKKINLSLDPITISKRFTKEKLSPSLITDVEHNTAGKNNCTNANFEIVIDPSDFLLSRNNYKNVNIFNSSIMSSTVENIAKPSTSKINNNLEIIVSRNHLQYLNKTSENLLPKSTNLKSGIQKISPSSKEKGIPKVVSSSNILIDKSSRVELAKLSKKFIPVRNITLTDINSQNLAEQNLQGTNQRNFFIRKQEVPGLKKNVLYLPSEEMKSSSHGKLSLLNGGCKILESKNPVSRKTHTDLPKSKQ